MSTTSTIAVANGHQHGVLEIFAQVTRYPMEVLDPSASLEEDRHVEAFLGHFAIEKRAHELIITAGTAGEKQDAQFFLLHEHARRRLTDMLGLGILYRASDGIVGEMHRGAAYAWHSALLLGLRGAISAAATALVLLLLRWLYSLVRRRQGLGLGDVKLAAAIAALSKELILRAKESTNWSSSASGNARLT